ncbi:VOC family protein [Nocardia sp. NPDC050697]|uniref:VOC family protein n=1 Tax=Nocardia sp. NPDC050697 TaxID=3155158 RepID=UPI0033CEA4D2
MRGVRIDCVVIACRDPARLAAFWGELLGYIRLENFTDSIRLGPPDGDGVVLLFAAAPAPTANNRLHLDLRPEDRAGTVDRALALGATRVDWGREITGWTVLADPEGNEFCVLQSRSDYEHFAAARVAADPDRLRSDNASSRG